MVSQSTAHCITLSITYLTLALTLTLTLTDLQFEATNLVHLASDSTITSRLKLNLQITVLVGYSHCLFQNEAS